MAQVEAKHREEKAIAYVVPEDGAEVDFKVAMGPAPRVVGLGQEIEDALNGDLYLPNDQGEADVGDVLNYVHIPQGAPFRAVTGDVLTTIAAGVQENLPGLKDHTKNLVWALRVLSWRAGLLFPHKEPSALKCRYNEAKYVPRDTFNLRAEIPWLKVDTLRSVGMHFTNIVCLVAYMFRWKGHHYRNTFGEIYAAKSRKIPNLPADLIAEDEWEHVATRGLHAIAPMVLDNFWKESVVNGTCARPLALRFNVPCAGTAAYYTIYAGLADAQLLARDALDLHDDLVQELRALVEDLLAHRWKGGINRNFYGGDALPPDRPEARYGVLAAIVHGINTTEENGTELGQAASLKRTARNAPFATNMWRAAASSAYRAFGREKVQNALGLRLAASVMRINLADQPVGGGAHVQLLENE